MFIQESAWFLSWEVWAILGVVLAIGEVLVGTTILLPLGLAAGVVALLLGLGDVGVLAPPFAIGDWKSLLLAYSTLAVASVFLIRWAFRRSTRNPDVNDY